jgi:farnesol dehydrogenase
LKILVTGGTGFLGKAVVRELCARGHDVRVLARGTSNLTGLPEAVSIVKGDVTVPEDLDAALSGCAALFHMAALVKVWVPEREAFDRVNIGGLENALASARRAGARIVYTSSFIALGPTGPEPADETRPYPGPPYRNDYERTKVAADSVAREAAARGDDIVILYPGVIYGPGDLTEGNIIVRMLLDHARGRLPGFVGPGDRLWSYAFVEDVAKGHASALEKGKRGERYILCGENATQVALFDLFRDLAGIAPPKRHLPYAAAALAGRLLWLWAELTGHPPLLTHEAVQVFREHWAYSSRKAEEALSYRMTPLREGLGATVSWLRGAGLV